MKKEKRRKKESFQIGIDRSLLLLIRIVDRTEEKRIAKRECKYATLRGEEKKRKKM